MQSIGQYDAQLQMFCEPDVAKLRFLRWLIEEGKLEHATCGEPAGEYAQVVAS